jgi:hypothetical protein
MSLSVDSLIDYEEIWRHPSSTERIQRDGLSRLAVAASLSAETFNRRPPRHGPQTFPLPKSALPDVLPVRVSADN